MSELVVCKDVVQEFRTGFWMGRVRVLHGVSLKVGRGTVMGFLGRNGAGKTTLIHLIAGIRRAASGSVTVGGFPADTPEARRRVGYLPERPYFHEHLTGNQLLRYFGELSGMGAGRIRDRSRSALAEVGLQGAGDRPLSGYSKGMLQRIGLAQAILHEPEFLLLDEPMSGLDPAGRREIRDLIRRLGAGGRTILFSTHVIPDIEALCSSITVIEGGRIQLTGGLAEFLASKGEGKEIRVKCRRDQLPAGVEEGAEILEEPDSVLLRFQSSDQGDRAVALTAQQGLRLVSVQPLRPALEEFFSDGRLAE